MARKGVGAVGRALVVALCLVAAACNAPAPTTSSGPSGSAAASGSGATPAGSAGPSISPFDQLTAVEAAQAEVDEVHRLREEAGFAKLLGPAGPKILENLDAARQSHGEKTLPLIAKELGFDLSAGPSGIASIRGLPVTHPRDFVAWDGSMLGQVSATATMVMAMLPEAIATAAGMRPEQGSMSHPETYNYPDHDGVHEQVDITTRYTINIAAGKASLDVFISSVDTITRVSDHAQVARLEGNAHGHIDVSACPDHDGVSPGSYELTLQEEAVRPGSANAGDSSSTKTPFNLFDGDDAHLLRVEANLGLGRGAHGPEAPAGDWGFSASVPVVIQPGGGVAQGDPTNVQDSNANADQENATFLQAGGAERYLGLIGRETEKYWRSGACIELKPSQDSRKVDASEHIHLSVDSFGAFDGDEINTPITAAFTGKQTLEPANQPVDPPATFDFTAGGQPNDTGTIDLLQTGKRGIGKKQIVFTVQPQEFLVTYDGRYTYGQNGWRLRLLLQDVDLSHRDDGTFRGLGTIEITGSVHIQDPGRCTGSTSVSAVADAVVTATVDEGDKNLLRLQLEVSPSGQTVNVPCGPIKVPLELDDHLNVWELDLATPYTQDILVTVGTPVTITGHDPGGSSSTVISVKPKQP